MHRRPRRTRGLIAVVVLLLVASACGGGGDGDGAGGQAGGGEVDPSQCPVDALEGATGPVEVTFWHGMTAANEETLTELTNEYNASQDRVRVSLVYSGTYDDTLDKYLTALRGGDLPDLVQLEETTLQLMIDSQSAVPAGACIEATDYDTSDFLDPVMQEFTVQDVLWPMPFNVSTPVLYYNRRAFTAAGLNPDDPPATLDELRAASQAIVDSGAARHGMSLELSPWYPEQWYAKAAETVVNNDNGREARATAATLDQPVGEEIFAWIKDMVDSGLALNVGRNPSGSDHLFAIAGGDAGMTVGSTAALGSVYDVLEQNPELGQTVEIGVGPMPGPGEASVVPGGAALWIINRSPDAEQAAAWDYVSWLDQPEQIARWHTGTGYIPIRQASADMAEVQQLWDERPGFEVAYRQLVDAPSAVPGPVIGGYPEFREALTTNIERMILEGVSPADAVERAQQETTEAIETYNERTGN